MPKVLALAVNFASLLSFYRCCTGISCTPASCLWPWWMFVALFAMLAYYGLYVSDGVSGPRGGPRYRSVRAAAL
ncbi:MAG: hypothetical protein ACLR7Z_11010 [Bilophila wadsworthia]